jgi:hypothetical protein
VEPDRLRRRWAINRAYWEGVSTARIRRLNGQRNMLPAISSAAKALPLVAIAPFAPARHEFDIRLAYNCGFVVETVKAML